MHRHVVLVAVFGLVLALAVVVKLAYSLSLLGERIYIHRGKDDTRVGKDWTYLRKHLEFAFLVIMSCVLLFLFNPWRPQLQLVRISWTIDLLFVFGLVLLWSADWSLFQPGESRRVVRHLAIDSWFEKEAESSE